LSETICSIRTKFWWNSHWMVLFQRYVRRFGPQWLFHQGLVLNELLVPDKMVLCEFPIGSYVKLSTAVQPSWSEGGTTRHNFGGGPSNDYFIKVWFQLSNWFQTRRYSAVVLLLKAALIQVSDYRLLWASCSLSQRWPLNTGLTVITHF
jgi:hypothetical protein